MPMTVHFSGSSPDAAFWDRIAPKYARKKIAEPAAYEATLHHIRDVLRPTDRLLEIGCGTGSTACLLAQEVAEVTATDFSASMIAIARSKLRADDPGNLRFLQADASTVIDDGTFDVVLASSVLHLIKDQPAVLAGVYRQLRPGGAFISKTPCLAEANPAIRILVKILGAVGVAPRVTMLTEAELSWQFQQAGFAIELSKRFDRKQLSPMIIARKPAG